MPEVAALAIRSPDLAPLEEFPVRFTGDGEDAAPVLVVSGVPDGAKELAIIVHDPDAALPHGFTHWVLYGVPAIDHVVSLASPALRVGPNGTGEHVYIGPKPPRGHGRHHYFFTVYALDEEVIGLPTREQFLERYGVNVTAQGRFVAYYERLRDADRSIPADA